MGPGVGAEVAVQVHVAVQGMKVACLHLNPANNSIHLQMIINYSK